MIGIVVGGVASGVGKTTLTLGLIGALSRRGLTVQPFKVGPDYIDPSHHTQAAGRPSRNLDSWMLPEPALRELFARAVDTADAAVIEGVMGLFDGRSGEGETGSTAQVAKMLGLPVLLVLDAAKAARSVAAVVLGCRALDPDLNVIGVVLNNVASENHARIAGEPIEREAGVPVLGWLPRDPVLRQEERYLGLVPAAERQLAPDLLARLTARVLEHIDVDRLIRLATVARPALVASGVFPTDSGPIRARIAVARDEAFSFYYQDNLDLLAAWGAEIVPFSPLHDAALPSAVDGVYLGGGFPELYARDLAANEPMLASIRGAAALGLPIYGECGGMMYLRDSLLNRDGVRHNLAGVIPGWSRMDKARLTLGYREVRARRPSLLHDKGDTVRGHEFHWSVADQVSQEQAAYEILGSDLLDGYARDHVLASYVHLHFASDVRLAPRLVDACAFGRHSSGPSLKQRRPLGAPALTPQPPLPQAGEGEQTRQGGVRSRGEPLARPQKSHTVSAGSGLLGRYGLPPAEIEPLSMRQIVGQLDGALPPDEPLRGLVARLVYAAGDPALADLIVVQGGAIEAATDALWRGAPLVVDVRMVAAGINRTALEQLGCQLVIALDAAESGPVPEGMTRTAAGIIALGPELDGAVVAIGNAPTALLALLDLVAAGVCRPAAVIGVPVGFVAAAESKAALLETDVPCIAVKGTRGGSPLAAAAVNHLLRLAIPPAQEVSAGLQGV